MKNIWKKDLLCEGTYATIKKLFMGDMSSTDENIS